MPTFAQFYDSDDETRESALVGMAFAPSGEVDPSDAVGDADWDAAVAADVAGGGADAYDDFRFRWDWEMTPGQRANALSEVEFRRGMDALFASANPAVDRPSVDPTAYAEQVLTARQRG